MKKKIKMKIPLLIKMVFLIGVMLIASNLYISGKNSELVTAKSIDKEKDFNQTLTRTLSVNIESITQSLIDEFTNYSTELIQAHNDRDLTKFKIVETKVSKNKNIYFLRIFQLDSSGQYRLMNEINHDTEKEEEKSVNMIDNSQEKAAIMQASQGNPLVERVKSPVGKRPVVMFSVPVIKDGSKFTYIATFYLNFEFFYQFIPKDLLQYNIFFTDHNGELIFYTQKDILNTMFAKSKKIIDDILASELSTITKQFQENDEDYFVISKRTKHNIVVYSRLSVFSVTKLAKYIAKQGQFVLGIVISIAFFFLFVFSSSITSPIEKLEQLLKEVSKGNFEVTASDTIRSRDEVGSLARSFDEMTSGLREREKMKNLFNKLHGEDITDELLNSELKPEGSSKNVVVFFSDIRGFTDFSEHHSPEEVVEMLNSYFEVMVRIINEYDGVVDKFIGDAIVAVWGIKEETDRDCHKAITACMEMRKALEVYNQERIDQGKNAIFTGAGLNTGRVISGTIGSTQRMEYTVIGDTVNTAARIEASTKGFGTDLLISQSIKDKIEKEFIIEKAGEVKAKGKSDALCLYNVLGTIDESGVKHIVKTPYSSYKKDDGGGGKTQIVNG
ncbi:MAG: HAMP domain-containing protein [Halobacteriovoraceae bacterium]|nr:HAMP domain-containing protein [Halobacteriovoraceae bacterium]